MKNNKNNIEILIQEILGCLISFEEVSSIWVVGSYARTIDIQSGIDLLMLIDGLSSLNSLKSHVQNKLENQLIISNFNICDDALQFCYQETIFSIAIHPLSDIDDTVLNFSAGKKIEGQKCVWAASCRLPEAVCADILNSKVLYDPYNYKKSLVKRLKPYPEQARKAIELYCSQEVLTKCNYILEMRNKSSNMEMIFLLLADITVALFRLAFARNSIYLEGFKEICSKKTELDTKGKEYINFAEQIIKLYGLGLANENINLFDLLKNIEQSVSSTLN
jgi:predicted nucleotidyltransferase